MHMFRKYGVIPYHCEGCDYYDIRKDPMLMRPIKEERLSFFCCRFGVAPSAANFLVTDLPWIMVVSLSEVHWKGWCAILKEDGATG
jgi:hypothetical protein